MAKYVSWYSHRIEWLEKQGERILENGLNNVEILRSFARYGYGKERFVEGQRLFEKMKEKYEVQEQTSHQQEEIRQGFRLLRNEATKRYRKDARRSGKILSGRTKDLERLGLMPPLERGFVRVEQFYREISKNTEIQDLLSAGGLSSVDLEAGQEAWERASKANKEQREATKRSKEAARERDRVAKAFSKWIYNFWKIGEVALFAQPELMEKVSRKE